MAVKTDIVDAKYLGDTQVVFPHLAEVERPGTEDAYAEWAATMEGLNPRCVVNPGDVFPVDRYSAEGREDLDIVKSKSTPKTKEG